MKFLFYLTITLFAFKSVAQHDSYQPLQCHGKVPSHFLSSPTANYEAAILPGSAYRNRHERFMEMNFLSSSHYWVNELLISGNVLYGNEIDTYLNDLVMHILASNGIDNDVIVHPVKSAYYNAFATDLGYIFVNLGLIAKVRNEAELAFVICHELAHYFENHNLKGVQNQFKLENSKVSKRSSVYEKILKTHSHSREIELDADSLGFALYVKAGYHPQKAIEGFDLLANTSMLANEIDFSLFQTFAGTSYVVAPGLQDSILKIITSRDSLNDDSLSTHPAAVERKMRISRADAAKGSGATELVSGERFKKCRELATFECMRIAFMERNFHEAAYFAQASLPFTSDSAYTRVSFLRAMIGLLSSKIYDPERNYVYDNVPGLSAFRTDSNSAFVPMVSYFLALKTPELLATIERNFIEMSQEYPEYQALSMMRNWFIEWSDEFNTGELHEYRHLIAKTDNGTLPSFSEGRFFIDPMFLCIDFRRQYKVQFKISEEQKLDMIEKTRKKNKTKQHYVLLSTSDKQSLNTEVMNGIALIKDRVREVSAMPGKASIPPLEYNRVLDFCKKYDRSKVRFTRGIEYKFNHRSQLIFAEYYYIITIPLAIIHANTAKKGALYEYSDLDLLTGEQKQYPSFTSRRGVVNKLNFQNIDLSE